MAEWTLTLVFILTFVCFTNAYKILVISPMPGKSHAILGDGLVRHLSAAGHEVTYVTAILPQKSNPNVTVVDVSKNTQLFDTEKIIDMKKIIEKTSELMNPIPFFTLLTKVGSSTMENPNVQKLLDDTNIKFDAMVVEWMFTEVYAGLLPIFDCPLIWFSSVEPHWMITRLVDEPLNPAYNVDTLSSGVPPFSFVQRVKELGYQIMGRFFQKFLVEGLENVVYEKNFIPYIKKKGKPVLPLEYLKFNASLVLSNSHVSMGLSTRLTPNFVNIGGFHIDTEVKPLPQDLQKIMDNAKHGVIYFSLGSNLRSKNLPENLQRSLLNMFGELKQTVLWKFEKELPDRPSNVHILQWAPQQSILAHKNCKLFITHGGLLSTTETIHFGVPIIGIPVFADQFLNVERAVMKGFAKRVDLSYTMADELKDAIKDVFENPRYTTKVKELSMIYHDRPVPPSKELVHWVEHVVKTNGAPHLRSPALLVPWYQKCYLDLILVVLILLYTLIYSLKYLFKYICSKKSKQGKKKTN